MMLFQNDAKSREQVLTLLFIERDQAAEKLRLPDYQEKTSPVKGRGKLPDQVSFSGPIGNFRRVAS